MMNNFGSAIERRPGHSKFWRFVGGAVVLAVVAGVVVNLNDIRRYIKISTM